jgi:DNA-binding MarR family transcriptional regulator
MPPYTAATMPSDSNVGRLISRIRHALMLAVDERLAPLGLTAAQWSVVVYLAEDIASTPAELAGLLNYDRGAMTRLIDRLEAKGFVTREPNRKDRRSVTLSLTNAGRKAYPAIRPLIVDVLNELLQGFNAAEVAQLESLLLRMLKNVP